MRKQVVAKAIFYFTGVLLFTRKMLEGIRHPYFHCIQTENETQEASLALKKSGASEEEVFFPCCMFLRESLGLQSRKMCRFVTSYSFLRMTATHYFLSAN